MIKAIKDNYADDQEVIDICESALLSFGTVDSSVGAPPTPDVPDVKTAGETPPPPDVDWDDFD